MTDKNQNMGNKKAVYLNVTAEEAEEESCIASIVHTISAGIYLVDEDCILCEGSGVHTTAYYEYGRLMEPMETGLCSCADKIIKNPPRDVINDLTESDIPF